MPKGIGGAVAKIFGLSAANDDENEKYEKIKEHKEHRRQLRQRENDIEKLDSIMHDLQTEYTQYKHSVFFVRYGQMKRMIKSAVEQEQKALHDIENPPKEPEVECQGGLRQNAKRFAQLQKEVADLEKYYSERSTTQLDEEIRNLQIQLQALDEEFSRKRRLLEELGTEYENTKTMIYHRKYMTRKQMIKKTFRAPTPPNGEHRH